MKIKKFESNISESSFPPYKSDDYDYEYGDHVFVLARYKEGWENIQRSFKNDEFVPCMISGNPVSKWGRRDLYIIGNNQSYNPNDFEILKGSDKGFQEMIEIYTSSKKFNI